ncbi:30S ribosomal protein S12 methylthiotransferase RimO [Oceanirhabdus sp. W0125-5]|uniref:30S ribosomal protein S12 methylthiotransferase RimO n=1 Tax=Oceanirhabdus sp. W0125-5 TaxID=2999116 RepID=UPI0022F2BD06|nr:30S ribosomal protein S12 methylthiotransferase RimO [Oceanirhabdus sp. W0125-5]WBW94846.1 30S ribosomal protein S12 methylthiotransferase RimO [Oceanirhabdus sp. W0125-5]
MKDIKVGLINLGCDKNRIDSEIMLGRISKELVLTNNIEEAHVLIINTCGFIEASKQESINTILEMANYKEGNCKVLIATGCLTQRYGDELLELMPELDAILGVNDYDKILEVIEKAYTTDEKIVLCSTEAEDVNEGDRIITTGAHSAYLRIAEGCDNKCAYCAIPAIRGKYRSRTKESIIDEAKSLAKQGVKEVILVAQDTTCYGKDIYGKKVLHELVREISSIDGIEWIRILYCYAEEITDELIKEIKENDKVCKYLDIPMQHISDNILKKMRRRGRRTQIESNIRKLRKEIPNIILRTTFIVGFPGETDEDFTELYEFIKDVKFDRVGVFKYSKEEGTEAYNMEDQIEEDIKIEREEKLMLLQQEISYDKNQSLIGETFKVIVDNFDGEVYVGRNFGMAPEVDGDVIISCEEELTLGSFINVKITGAMEYDLVGVIVNESCE